MATPPLAAAIPVSPIARPDTGQITPEWRALFIALQQRTGGTEGTDTAALEQELAQERSARATADQALQTGIAGASASGTTSLQAETAARIAADATLLPKNGGVTGIIGFQGTAPIAKPTVTGAKGGNAALASLLAALANYGLITDSST